MFLRFEIDEDRRVAVVSCCDHELVCDGDTNTCPHCEQEYNWNGTPLAPSYQWQDEYGNWHMDVDDEIA